MIISYSVLKVKNISGKIYRENQNGDFMFSIPPNNSAV